MTNGEDINTADLCPQDPPLCDAVLTNALRHLPTGHWCSGANAMLGAAGGGEGRGGRHSSRGAIGRAAHLQRTGERRGGEEMKGTDRETEGAWTWIEFTADYTGLGLGTSTAAASSEASPEMGLGASTAAASSEASPVRGLFGRA